MQPTNITTQACEICNERAAAHGGRCVRCYRYWIAHKKQQDRPPWGKQINTICLTCRERPAAISARCARCQSWWNLHRFERPLSTEPRNRNQRNPPLCRNGCDRGAVARGLCQACFKYLRRNGVERPKHLIEKQRA